jgi:hypothetical protein
MDDRRFNRLRFIRFALWVVATYVTFVIVECYAPRRAVLVLCFSLCLMVPAVLVPLRNKQKA